MITTVLNNGLTQLEAESGKWLTENNAEWHAVWTAAQARQISFATTE